MIIVITINITIVSIIAISIPIGSIVAISIIPTIVIAITMTITILPLPLLIAIAIAIVITNIITIINPYQVRCHLGALKVIHKVQTGCLSHHSCIGPQLPQLW